jgi:Ca2+-transporting ATPase
MFFSLFVFLSFWNLFNARAFESGHTAFHDKRNSKVFFSTLLAIIGGQFLIVDFGGPMFNVVHINWIDWAIIIGSTSLVMIIPLIYTYIKHAFKR